MHKILFFSTADTVLYILQKNGAKRKIHLSTRMEKKKYVVCHLRQTQQCHQSRHAAIYLPEGLDGQHSGVPEGFRDALTALDT